MKFKITGQLITDILEENGYRVNFIEHRSASDLRGICFFSDVSEACASWNLYLPLEDRRLPLHHLSGELTFVTTMRYDPLEVPANISLIAVENSSSLHKIYNKIFDIFVFFRQWELELKLAVTKRDLQHIAKLGMDALHNPLFVHDINYNYVLWTKRVEGQTVPTVNFRTGVVTTPIDMLPILTNSAAYKETLGKRGAHIYFNYNLDQYRVLYVNLWNKNKEYIGRLCVDEMAAIIMPSHYYIAEYYASQIEVLLENQENVIPTVHEQFKEFLKLVMRQNIFESDEHARQLSDVLWEKYNTYQVFCFSFPPDYRQLPSKENVCYELETIISEGCALIDREYVWFVVNMQRGGHTEEKLCGLIAGHFKDLAVHIGISNEFSQFWDLSYAASQAEYAVKVNAAAAFQKLLLLPFSKHAVSIILAYGKNCLPLPFILSPAIEKLKTYDRENQSDFLYTLQVLLACERNVTEAAAMLFIHRTTMAYRISRIESIAGIDLDDCNERLYLQICFSLLDSAADVHHE